AGVDVAAVIRAPSSAPPSGVASAARNADVLRLLGLPGILTVPSAVPENSRSTGNGRPEAPAAGLNTAVEAAAVLGSATSSGPISLSPPHACNAAAMAVSVRTFFIVRIVFLPMFILNSFLLCAGRTRRPSPCTKYQLPRRRSAAGWK